MYEYIPPKNLKRISGLVMMLSAAAAVLFLVPSYFNEIPFRWSFQLCGICIIGVIIYLTTRYVTKSYIYRIIPREDSDGAVVGQDFTVTEVSGKSQITVCRIGLENISAVMRIEPRSEKGIKEAIIAEKRHKFIYVCDITPPIKCCIFAEECGEPLAITITADDRLFEILGEALVAGFGDDEDMWGEEK